MYMKKQFPFTIFFTVVFSFLVLNGATQEVYTYYNSTNGTTAIRIVDDDGVKSWKAFDHRRTSVLVDEENPMPGDCAKDYTKDPTTKLKGGTKYWILIRDCAENPPASNKATFEVTFFNDAARADEWHKWGQKNIPDPDTQQSWIYWVPPILIILFFVLWKKR